MNNELIKENNEEYIPISCFDCKYEVWWVKNYCRKNKRLITERYFKERHPDCPLNKEGSK